MKEGEELTKTNDKLLSMPEISKESLGELLNRLIATQENIRPEEVTVEYIQKQRESRLYPTTRYNISTEYGGYDPNGLEFFTQDELCSIQKRVEEELGKF